MNNLLKEFEVMLDDEAKKVVNEMVNMYHKRIIVNKPYGEIVRDLVPKELQYYTTSIELRTYHFFGSVFLDNIFLNNVLHIINNAMDATQLY